MRNSFVYLSAVFVTLGLTACSETETPAGTAPQAADAEPAATVSPREQEAGSAVGSDPTVVDPDHYTTEFENDAVRIVRIRYGPGEESVMHYHPDSVAVFLTDIELEMTMPDGSVQRDSAPAGVAVFNPAGAHAPKNVSDSPWEVVEIELKPGASGGVGSGGPDPTVVDADHYTAEFENDAVRIVRIAYGPGEESVMHYHPDAVAVFLTDHLVEMTMPDGLTEEISASAGDTMFLPGGQHLPKNVSDSAWELVLVELK